MLCAWFLTPPQWKRWRRREKKPMRTSTLQPLFLMNLTDWLGQNEINIWRKKNSVLEHFHHSHSCGCVLCVFVSTNYNIIAWNHFVPSHTQYTAHIVHIESEIETSIVVLNREWKVIKKRNWHHRCDYDQYTIYFNEYSLKWFFDINNTYSTIFSIS